MGSVVFLGSKDVGFAVLCAMVGSRHQVAQVICFDDRDDDRSQLLSFQELAAGSSLSLELATDPSQVADLVTASEPDAVVVSGWYSRIPVEEVPGVPFYGFHASPLPRYRGGAPLVWQILRGEPDVAVSMFELVPELDEGRIVEQRRRSFGEDETIADALVWASRACAEMTSANLEPIVEGSVALTEQDHTQATYCSQRTPQDGMIDWTVPARSNHDFVRAQTRPYPGAYTRLPDGTLLRIWRTELDPREYHGPPGAVVERDDTFAVVACGEGVVRIVEAQVEAQQPQAPSSILTDLTIRLG